MPANRLKERQMAWNHVRGAQLPVDLILSPAEIPYSAYDSIFQARLQSRGQSKSNRNQQGVGTSERALHKICRIGRRVLSIVIRCPAKQVCSILNKEKLWRTN